MAVKRVVLEEFLVLAKEHPVLDVRSPGEYTHAHIPGAYSLPLFTDEERKVVGTAYKQESREKAIKIGLKYFGKKMVTMVEEVENLLSNLPGNTPERTVLVHCWRGGMRSAGVAWLLDLYGFRVYTLIGGYKVYRNWVLQQFEQSYNIHIVGGYTGSAKTHIIRQLRTNGEAIIDFEGLANHKGSAFGSIGMPKQPSQEMFENMLATELSSLRMQDGIVWMEDESQRIGDVNIPSVLFKQMRTKPVYFLDVPFEERLNHIVQEYGKLDTTALWDAIMRIQKRLGGLEAKKAVGHLVNNELKECFSILLKYYDKWYEKSLHSREHWEQLVTKVPCSDCNTQVNAIKLQRLTTGQLQNI